MVYNTVTFVIIFLKTKSQSAYLMHNNCYPRKITGKCVLMQLEARHLSVGTTSRFGLDTGAHSGAYGTFQCPIYARICSNLPVTSSPVSLVTVHIHTMQWKQQQLHLIQYTVIICTAWHCAYTYSAVKAAAVTFDPIHCHNMYSVWLCIYIQCSGSNSSYIDPIHCHNMYSVSLCIYMQCSESSSSYIWSNTLS